MERQRQREDWRYVEVKSGGQSVTISGLSIIQQWCVGISDSVIPLVVSRSNVILY